MLQDLKVHRHIDVVDRLRRHGIHGKIDRIMTENGETTVEFTESHVGTQYKWRASAMGLVSGIGAFSLVHFIATHNHRGALNLLAHRKKPAESA